jgi:hypothetical protein
VVEGYDTVEAISKLSTDSADRPRDEARIERVTIEES